MITSFVIVGRPIGCVIVDRRDGAPECILQLEAEAPFRNENRTIGNDTFEVRIWKGLADECRSALTAGSVVAVKGRIEPAKIGGIKTLKLIGEKLSYIAEPSAAANH